MKKNITRRLTTALLAAVMCVSMAACGSKTDDTKTDGTGEADIAEMPIQYAPATKMYNHAMCEALGITAPEGYEAME